MSTLTTNKPNEHTIAADLVHRIRQGDRAAEEELVERYSRGLHYMLRRLSRSPELADDLHQETFRVVLERLRQRGLEEPEKLAEFLRGVARNLFRLEIRRRVRHPLEHLENADTPDLEPERPLREVLAGERSKIIRQLISELTTDRDRQVLYRFYIAEEEKDTICAELGLDHSHFKRVLFRARQRFKELLERFEKRQVAQISLTSHLSLFCFVFLTLFMLMWSSRVTGGDHGPWLLEPGVPIERQLAGGYSNVYQIETQRSEGLVRVEQKGIDVVIEVSCGDSHLGPIDAPTYRIGTETLVIPESLTTSQKCQIIVRSPSSEVGPGRYTIELSEFHDASHTDRQNWAAYRAESKAGTLNFQIEHAGIDPRSASELRETAMVYLQTAQEHWRVLGVPNSEAQNLFSLAVLTAKSRRPQEALRLYDAALELWRKSGNRTGEAAALTGAGLTSWRMGDHHAAEERLREALFLYKGLDDRYGQAIVQNNLCLQAHSQGDLMRAERCYETALDLLLGLGELREESTLLSNLGSVNRNLGEPEKSLQYYSRALELREQADDRTGRGRILNNLAVLYSSIGETELALSHYSQALNTFQETDQREWEARTLHNLGGTYLDLGDLQRSLAFLHRALEIRRDIEDRRGEMTTLHLLGHARRRLREFPAALAHHQRALSLARQLNNRREEAQILKSLGRVRLDQGEPLEAYDFFTASLGLLENLEDLPRKADLLLLQGEALTTLGQPTEAEALLKRSLELQRQIANRPGEAKVIKALARVERSLGNLQTAHTRLEEALAMIESIRIGVVSPKLRATILGLHRRTYEMLIDVLMDRHTEKPAAGWERAAFEVSERARARVLLELLDEVGASQDIDPELLQRRRSLERRLSAKLSRQIELYGESATRHSTLSAERFALATELENLEASIQQQATLHNQTVSNRNNTQPLQLTQIQELLDPNTWLLEYVLGERRSFLWRVTAAQITPFELPKKALIEKAARQTYRAFSTFSPQPDPHEVRAANELGEMLLGPIAEELSDQRLVIVADGILHSIPFAALHLERASSRKALIERHEITYLPSASALDRQRQRTHAPAPQKWLAILGDPVFNLRDPRLQEHHFIPSAVRNGRRPGILDELSRLPSSGREARAIAALAPSEEVLLALGFDANRSRVLGGELRDYQIVHLATHGLAHPHDPELSGLVFSKIDREGQPHDGFLSLHDLYSLELSAELVVLSGCETALGPEVPGEGLWGLTRGFLHIGVPRVAASLWRIEDEATAELMIRFYRGLRIKNLTPAAALRKAQMELRSQRQWQDPYFWAAFVLQGDWR